MKEKAGRRREEMKAATIAVFIWVIWDTVTGAYFGAFFFGVQPPSYLNWVGSINPIVFNVIDTIGLIALVLVVVLSRPSKRRARD